MEQRKIISVKDLEVKFNVRSRVLTAIRKVSLDIYTGEVIAIVGESGSGKSVLTKTFSGMLDSNGFISNGSIIYDDEELARTDVLLTNSNVKLYNILLKKLKKFSQEEYASEVYNVKQQLIAQYKKTFEITDEQKAEYDAKIAELNHRDAEIYNELKNLQGKENSEEKAKVLLKKKEAKEVRKQVELEHKALIHSTHAAAKANKEATAEFNKKVAELDAKIAELSQQRITGKTRDRNAKLAKEMILSVNRYPLVKRLQFFRIILKGLHQAMREGVDLTDEKNVNEIFEKATFRVQFLSAEGEIYRKLEKDVQESHLAQAKIVLKEAGLSQHFDFILKQAEEYQVNGIYVLRVAEKYVETAKIKELNEQRLFNVSHKVFREETMKKGTILHGHTLIDLTKVKYTKDWQLIRGARVSTVFQDPMTSLNPIKPIGKQITEVIIKHTGASKEQAKAEAISLMEKVGIVDAANRFKDYPFQYSGGMRQRIVIAIALASKPEVLICDEPTTALDVTIQAQILDLIKSLQKELGFTTIYITHDLGVVASVADRVVVLYAGQIVEYGKAEEVFYEPKHPYTWALLSSLPQLSLKGTKLFTIKGTPPSLYNAIKGDAFAERNPYALEIDFIEEPPMFKVTDTHYAKTWLLDPRAPKIEPPEIIRNLHEKLSAK